MKFIEKHIIFVLQYYKNITKNILQFFGKNIYKFLKFRKVSMNKKKYIFLGIIALVAFILLFINIREAIALSKYGSTGNEVTQIQKKLKNWGYYTGNVDGIYGSKTVAAVKKFQSKNGLTVDGIAGPKTLSALGISSNSNSNTSTSNSSNLNLLSRLVYSEARGEPYKGQVAVAAVVLNRVASSSFPNTISGVIYQSGSFDAVSDGQINLTPDSTARKAAQDALNGWDPTSRLHLLF